jgi:hypothetical protein
MEVEKLETGEINTPAGDVKRISTTLSFKDKIEGCKVRWGINRYNYKIPTGIYAVGNPGDKSPVLVTADYKLTFDYLRRELTDIDLWILVMDTKGINVWCAAGKGTFGNYELLKVLNKVKLKKIISHKTLILPQLGAPGVAAHVIKKAGFDVVYGPVRAEDIKEFLNNGLFKTESMREVKFDFRDRLVLTPMEFIPDLKYAAPFLPVLFVFNFFMNPSMGIGEITALTLMNYLPLLAALFAGSVLVPLLLPYIPFRAFSLKGFTLGAIWSLVFLKYYYVFLIPDNVLVKAAYTCFILFLTSYTALQFTGSSTYTSFSGTTKETVYSIIAGGLLCAAGFILLIIFIEIMV